MKFPAKIIHGFPALAFPPDNRVRFQPDQRALVVVIHPPPPRSSRGRRAVQELRGDRRILQIPPCPPGPVVQIRRSRRQLLPESLRRPEPRPSRKNLPVILSQS